MHQSFFSRTLFACGVLLLVACGSSRSVQLEPVGSFESRSRPTLGNAHLVSAILGGTGIGIEGAAPAPGYQDIEFFPVNNADTLRELTVMNTPSHSRGPEPDLTKVNFKNQFALLVAHPSPGTASMLAGQHATFFSDVSISYKEDKVVAKIQASRLGDMDARVTMTSPWKGDIYAIDRRGLEKLEVQLYDETYVYSLSPDSNTGMPISSVQAQ